MEIIENFQLKKTLKMEVMFVFLVFTLLLPTADTLKEKQPFTNRT